MSLKNGIVLQFLDKKIANCSVGDQNMKVQILK